MRKIMIFSICTLLSVAAYGYNCMLSSIEGTYSSASIKGIARDLAFYNDTCYIISGDGTKLLMTKSNGAAVSNPFSSITFNIAMRIEVDDQYVFVLEWDALKVYNKRGVFQYTIPAPNVMYFWVKNKQEIMLVFQDKISVYNYNTRALLTSTTAYKFIGNRDDFLNDGNKLYNVCSKLTTYEYKGGTIHSNDITTPLYRSLGKDLHYLSSFVGSETLWFNYFDRSKAFFVNSAFNTVVRNCSSFLPTSKNPTRDQIEMESGVPRLRIFSGGSHVVNLSSNKIEFYRLLYFW